jgi:catechol 2,3-dioxygenase-like lactoylglutathione lyase family enzyme
MKILFVASFAVIAPDPAAGKKLFVETLGLPLEAPVPDDDYVFSEHIEGSKHFGVWPLAQAARACFGSDTWPADRPVPQASVEFEVEDEAAVAVAEQELVSKGYQLIHSTRLEPWRQTITRLQSAEGLIVGVCYTPWLHTVEV